MTSCPVDRDSPTNPWAGDEGSREIYRRLFEEAGDVLFAATRDGRLVEVNRSTEDLTGRTRDELIGVPFLSFLAAADRERGAADLARAAAGEPIRAEYRLQATHGEVWFQVSLRRTELPDGRTVVTGIAREVQVRRDLETQLERHNAELQALLDACTAIGARRTFDELAQSIAFEAFQLIHRRAAITLYAARSPGAPVEVVAVAGRSSRVALDGTVLASDDGVEAYVHRATSERSTLWFSDNEGVQTTSGRRVSSLAVVPLLADAGDRVVGAILAETPGEEMLADESVALLRALGDRAAAAVDNLGLSEERLRVASEQRSIVDNLGDGVLVIDSDGEVVEANPAAADMLTSWALATPTSFTPPERWSMARLDGSPLPASEMPCVAAVRDGRSVAQRSLLLRTSVGDRILTVSAEPLHRTEKDEDDDSDQAAPHPHRAATLIFRDMTREIAMKTELERRAADLSAEKDAFRRYAQALSQFADAVVITSAAGRIEEWLGAAPQVFGRQASNVIGQPISEVLLTTGGQQPLTDALGASSGWSREVELLREGGTPFTALVTASLVQDDDGTVVARILLVKDVSEPKKLRESLTRTQRMEGLGTLAGGVAHEINNPLAVLSMNLSSLKEVHAQVAHLVAGAPATKVQQEANELVEESVAAVARIASIVRTLQLFSRPQDEDAADQSVGQIVDAAAAVALNEIRHRAVLIKQYAAPGASVRANARELEQAILNVIVNALQAIPEGDVERNSIVLRIEQIDDRVRIQVEDTGCGIPEELRPQVFDPFVSTKQGEGTGLGLSITHDVVTRLGGRIDLESQVGRGTRVSLWLPAVAPPAAAASGPAAAAQKRPRVLVVEDEPHLRKAYRRILSGRYEVVEAGSGQEALTRMKESPFDLVLCDLQMPSMSGADLFERSVAEGLAAADRYLFVTGGAFTPHVKQFAEEHASRCLLKPVEVAVLLQRIERELGRV